MPEDKIPRVGRDDEAKAADIVVFNNTSVISDVRQKYLTQLVSSSGVKMEGHAVESFCQTQKQDRWVKIY